MIASYNGQALFGAAAEILTAAHPVRRQWNAFPGVNGRETLHLGTSGGWSVARFVQTFTDLATMASYEATWRGYQLAGTAHALIDTMGVTWPNVVVVAFSPTEKIVPFLHGGFSRSYQAEFEHLS